jgi:hypothetical protein
MVDTTVVDKINKEIETYFSSNKDLSIVPVKALMPAFIKAGIFKKDVRKGQPIRHILRELDEKDLLQQIPFVYAERKEASTYWYFKPLNAPEPTQPYKQEEKKRETETSSSLRFKSDEAYVIDLCDKVLGKKAYRQKKFPFLMGDLHKDEKTKTKLPIDAYYEELQLAVEFYIKRGSETESASPKAGKNTISGMPRSEQRIRYEQRKAKTLPVHGITLICLSNTNFTCDDKFKIVRNEANDIKIVEKALSKHIISE